MKGKIIQFSQFVKLLDDFDIIVLSETWLCSETINSELGLSVYNIFKCDRSIFFE